MSSTIPLWPLEMVSGKSASEGAPEGLVDGAALGVVDGAKLGDADGDALGAALGELLGLAEGLALGELLGLAVGLALGLALGETDGVVLGDSLIGRIVTFTYPVWFLDLFNTSGTLASSVEITVTAMREGSVGAAE